jgi:hypothetical protein
MQRGTFGDELFATSTCLNETNSRRDGIRYYRIAVTICSLGTGGGNKKRNVPPA